MNNLKRKLHQELDLFDPQKGPQNQTDILRLFDTVLRQNDESTLDRAPPLDAIIYALNGILHPTFLPEFMSEFLLLFTMVEFYRIRAVDKATLAIEMNSYYDSSPDCDPNISLLTSDEETYLTRLIEKQTDMRKIYMTVITQCCLFDLQRGWLSDSNTDFWSRWHEYLSVLDGTPSHVIHYKLSADEINQLRNVGYTVLEFMKTTVAAGQELDGPSIHQAIKTTEFQETYMPDRLPPHLLQAIGYHLDVVRDAVQKFNTENERASELRV